MELVSLIKSCSDNKFIFIPNFDKKIQKLGLHIACTETNDNLNIILSISEDNISFGPKPYTKFHNTQLSNLLSKKFNNINQIFEIIQFIKDNTNDLQKYCVSCLKELDYQSIEFVTCGSTECDYKYEELTIGNPVVDCFKDDPTIVQFLLQSAIDAITCQRKYDIFEPFPKYFLKSDSGPSVLDELHKFQRGEVSKLKNKNYDAYKDFDKLDKLLKDFDANKFFKLVDMCRYDYQIEKFIGKDIYILTRFIIKSLKVSLIRDDSLLKDCKIGKNKTNNRIYKIDHPQDKKEEFERLKKSNKTHYLFHGSRWHNWFSILRNGLKNCSGTKLMTAGAAYGNGIYLSDNLNLSYGYGTSKINNKNMSVVGVFEVIGEKNKYKKGGANVYVVPDEKVLIQRYLLVLSSKTGNIIGELNSVFNTKIYSQIAKTNTTMMSKGIKKLIREYQRIAKQDSNSLGFRVDVDNQNSHLWTVYITKFDEKYPIGKDMVQYGIDNIELEIKFPESYPFAPPFIRIIKPRFKYLTGHVTQAGALCMEILTRKGWSPACSIESLIITIKSEIIEGEGRLDAANIGSIYSEEEAKKSFVRIARGHGWL